VEPPAHHVSVALRLNRIQAPITNLGPGRRIGIWVQGCSLACPGCLSPSLWDPSGGRRVDVRTLADALAALARDFDGITVSGGEPFEQYGALMAFCAYLKSLSALTIVVFSGFRLDEIEHLHPDGAFREVLDYLIDGRYERHRHDGGWRGSSNQRLYRFINGRAVETPPWTGNEQTMMLSVPDARGAFLVGIPRQGELARLQRALRSSGLCVRFT